VMQDEVQDEIRVITEVEQLEHMQDEVQINSQPRRNSKHPAERVGLRQIKREQWEELLKLARCSVLDCKEEEYVDSYILSESSLFVASYRVILKTCGTTTLLATVPALLQLAATVGLTQVKELFYSRHELMQPHQQHYPHNSFQHELEYLDSLFHGSAYTLGGRNSNEVWYLYTLNRPHPPHTGDATMELMMTDLDQEAMKMFFKTDKTGQQVTQLSGIQDLIPGADIHEFLFEPCGYSCNALIDDAYFTIHVTPQSGCSYASFETDVSLTDYTVLINKVLAIFKPRYFSLNVFANNVAICGPADRSFDEAELRGFIRRDRHFYSLNQYTVNFGYFFRDGPDSGRGTGPNSPTHLSSEQSDASILSVSPPPGDLMELAL